MVFNLHDALEPVLAELGFERVNKQFHGRSGEIPMLVWFNPENRLKRIRSINVDCGPPEGKAAGAAPIYSLDLVYAATGDWKTSYRPEQPGWPEIMLDDFVRVAIPFIRKAVDADAIVDMLLLGEIPPMNLGRYPAASIEQAYRIGRDYGRRTTPEQALEFARSIKLDWHQVDGLRRWAKSEGIDLVLDDPPFSLRRAVDRYLPLRHQKYHWGQSRHPEITDQKY